MTLQIPIETVAPDQVIAAREYIRRVRNPDLLSERIIAIAGLPLDEFQDAWNKQPLDAERIRAAQLLIELRGGEQYVEPRVVAIAHARPEA